VIRVLQTLALPLGHVANLYEDKKLLIEQPGAPISNLSHRAGDGTRTHDLLLGKEVFYKLNYARMSGHRYRPRMPRARIELATP
jgi:hypothetical protein